MSWMLVITFFINGFSHVEMQKVDTVKECTELCVEILKNAPSGFDYKAQCLPIPKWSTGSTNPPQHDDL